jgi:hypothetical protein
VRPAEKHEVGSVPQQYRCNKLKSPLDKKSIVIDEFKCYKIFVSLFSKDNNLGENIIKNL